MSEYLLIILLVGTTIIFPNQGFFNTSLYPQFENVVEGTLQDVVEDSITVEVTQVWKGNTSPGDDLKLICTFDLNLEPGQQALFMVDSSGKLVTYGLTREGFYVLQGLSSPNVLTHDDLQNLASGAEPDFNTHESRITVHFPFSNEQIGMYVSQSGSDRIVESDLDQWDGRRVFGALCMGPGGTSIFGMHRSEDPDLYDPLLLAGHVFSFMDGVYSLDMWPHYPAFADLESYYTYCENGYVPLYSFIMRTDGDGQSSTYLEDESWILSNGRRFYLNGSRRRESSPVNQTEKSFFELEFYMPIPIGEPSTYGTLFIRLEGLPVDPRRSLLMRMLEAATTNTIQASISLREQGSSELTRLAGCTIDLYTPEWEIATDSSDSEYNGAVLSFTNTGRGNLKVDGKICPQLYQTLQTSDRTITPYNSALFRHPGDENLALLLHVSGVSSYPSSSPEYLLAGMLDSRYRLIDLGGELYTVDLTSDERNLLLSLVLKRKDTI